MQVCSIAASRVENANDKSPGFLCSFGVQLLSQLRRKEGELFCAAPDPTILPYRCFVLRILRLVAGLLQEILDDLLQRIDVHRLAHVPVLHERLLGVVALLHLHHQVQVLHHDALMGLGPGAVLLAGHDVMQCLQRAALLPHIFKLLRPFESILWACKALWPASESHVGHSGIVVNIIGDITYDIKYW